MSLNVYTDFWEVSFIVLNTITSGIFSFVTTKPMYF